MVKSFCNIFFLHQLTFHFSSSTYSVGTLSAVPGCLQSLTTSDQMSSDLMHALSYAFACNISLDQLISNFCICDAFMSNTWHLNLSRNLNMWVLCQFIGYNRLLFLLLFSFVLHSFISPFSSQKWGNKLTSQKMMEDLGLCPQLIWIMMC